MDTTRSQRTRRPRGASAGFFVAAAACLLLVAALAGPRPAHAQRGVHPPRIGQQFLSVGGTIQPGFFYDKTVPTGEAWTRVMTTGGTMARAGLHHILTERFIMSGEVDLGMQWLNEHTAQLDGQADSEWAFSWQVGLTGRWLPFGEKAGWSLGGGPHLYQAYLKDESLSSLGLALKAGRYIWTGRENFVLVEFGYALPFIQGISRGNTFSGSEEAVAKDWTFHRFGVHIQYGF